MHFTFISFLTKYKLFIFEWPCFSYTCGVFLCIESKHQNRIPTKSTISWPWCFHMGANKIIWAIPVTLMNVYSRIFSNVLNFLVFWIQIIIYYSNKINCLKSKPCSWKFYLILDTYSMFHTWSLIKSICSYLCYCWKNWKLSHIHTQTHTHTYSGLVSKFRKILVNINISFLISYCKIMTPWPNWYAKNLILHQHCY